MICLETADRSWNFQPGETAKSYFCEQDTWDELLDVIKTYTDSDDWYDALEGGMKWLKKTYLMDGEPVGCDGFAWYWIVAIACSILIICVIVVIVFRGHLRITGEGIAGRI